MLISFCYVIDVGTIQYSTTHCRRLFTENDAMHHPRGFPHGVYIQMLFFAPALLFLAHLSSLRLFQLMGVCPFSTKYLLALEKHALSKNPRCAERGEGWTLERTRCLLYITEGGVCD